jgi:DNA-directed RNA polymerase II subunit RPB4
VPCLSVSEANVILRRLIDRREKPDDEGRKGPPLPNTDVFVKTRDYLEQFARFRGETAVQQVEQVSSRLVAQGTISVFERAQLGMHTHTPLVVMVQGWDQTCANGGIYVGTLCCDTVEEARTLVPSLEGKVSDDDLQQVLDDISKLRDFS